MILRTDEVAKQFALFSERPQTTGQKESAAFLFSDRHSNLPPAFVVANLAIAMLTCQNREPRYRVTCENCEDPRCQCPTCREEILTRQLAKAQSRA